LRRILTLLFLVFVMSFGWFILLAAFSYLAIVLLIRVGFRGLDISMITTDPYDFAVLLLIVSSFGLAIRSVLCDSESSNLR
jgi:hypothetical protein